MNIDRLQKADWFIGLFLAAIFAPITRLLGRLLQRDHDFKASGTIVVMKLLGGGNFALAMPMLLGLRKSFPESRLIVVVTSATAQFARSIRVFDEVLVIDTRSIVRLICSAIKILSSIFRADTVLDLEIHSKLTTCFGLFTCARNRLGFFTNDFFLKEYLYTHLVFFHPNALRPSLFEQFALIMGGAPASHDECKNHLLKSLDRSGTQNGGLAVGVGCSDIGIVRRLNTTQWINILTAFLKKTDERDIVFLGSGADRTLAQDITTQLQRQFPHISIQNLCGSLALAESLVVLASQSYFFGIDSALLHFARILGVPSESFWGPTDPHTLLMPIDGYRETIHYKRLMCSPCIHVAERPPCKGRNICISLLFSNEEVPVREVPVREVLANTSFLPTQKA